jgi:hypothetical protein
MAEYFLQMEPLLKRPAFLPITVEVLNPKGCVIFSEQHNLNMVGSDGYFSILIGAGTTTIGSSLETLLKNIFQNTDKLTQVGGASLNCAGDYQPNSGDRRSIRISFNDGVNNISFTSDYLMNPAPQALVAETLQNKGPDDFIQSKGNVTQAALESLTAKSTELTSLASGSNTIYAKSNEFGGKTIDSTVTALGASDDGKVLVWRASDSRWIASTPATSGATSNQTPTDISTQVKSFYKTNGGTGQFLMSNGSSADPSWVSTNSAAGGISKVSVDITANYLLDTTNDKGKFLIFKPATSATLSLTTAAAAGNGFAFAVRNVGTALVKVQPTTGQNINGLASLNLAAGYSMTVLSNGVSDWYSIETTPSQQSSNFTHIAAFNNGTDSFIPQAGVYNVKVTLLGGGGGGGGGGSGPGGAGYVINVARGYNNYTSSGGSGGGGSGLLAQCILEVTPGSTYAVTVGSGGLGGTAGTNGTAATAAANSGSVGTKGGNGTSGQPGGASSFGSLVSASGGNGGTGGAAGNIASGSTGGLAGNGGSGGNGASVLSGSQAQHCDFTKVGAAGANGVSGAGGETGSCSSIDNNGYYYSPCTGGRGGNGGAGGGGASPGSITAQGGTSSTPASSNLGAAGVTNIVPYLISGSGGTSSSTLAGGTGSTYTWTTNSYAGTCSGAGVSVATPSFQSASNYGAGGSGTSGGGGGGGLSYYYGATGGCGNSSDGHAAGSGGMGAPGFVVVEW